MVIACNLRLTPLSLLPITITDEGVEENAIGVFWVSDGIDRCLVCFLPRHCILNCARYDGRVAQIVEFLKNSEEPADRRRSKKMMGSIRAAFFLHQERDFGGRAKGGISGRAIQYVHFGGAVWSKITTEGILVKRCDKNSRIPYQTTYLKEVLNL
jgi:hypothetical protein